MKYFEKLFIYTNEKITLNAPIQLMESALIKDTVENEIYLRNIFTNVSSMNIIAIIIEGLMYDITGELIPDNNGKISYTYQDIDVRPNDLFGNKIPIKLPNSVRKISISIKKVVLKSGEVIDYQNFETIVPCQPKPIILPKDFLKIIDNNEFIAEVHPTVNDKYWQCTCGRINWNNECVCGLCKRGFEQQEQYGETQLNELFEVHKENEYITAKKALENEEYWRARSIFEILKDYKDSKELYAISNKMLNETIEKRKAEQRKIEEIEREKQLELQKIAKKRKKKFLIIALSITTIVIILIPIIKHISELIKKQNEMQRAYESANYEKAMKIAEEIGDKEFYDKATYEYGINLIRKYNYKEAIKFAESVGNQKLLQEAQDKYASYLEYHSIGKAIDYYRELGTTEALSRVEELEKYSYLEGKYVLQTNSDELPKTIKCEIYCKDTKFYWKLEEYGNAEIYWKLEKYGNAEIGKPIEKEKRKSLNGTSVIWRFEMNDLTDSIIRVTELRTIDDAVFSILTYEKKEN